MDDLFNFFSTLELVTVSSTRSLSPPGLVTVDDCEGLRLTLPGTDPWFWFNELDLSTCGRFPVPGWSVRMPALGPPPEAVGRLTPASAKISMGWLSLAFASLSSLSYL